mgnify:CR=1 FL=1
MEKLSIKNLACKRGSRIIFDNISFEVKSGQTFLIKGSNGSGKTSLMRTLAGYIEPHEGEIFIDGKNIDTSDNSYFQFIGEKNALKNEIHKISSDNFKKKIFAKKNCLKYTKLRHFRVFSSILTV